MPPQGKDLGLRAMLAHAPLRRLWIAQLVSVFGDFLAIFAVFSLVSFKLHGTPAQVSLIMIAYLLPMALVSPAAGVFVDRWNPRRTMIASDLIRGFLILLLVPATELWQIYSILMGISVISSFFMPAQAITLRTLVPAEGLLAANALMMQAMQITQILSPAIAGILAKWLGEQSCFYLDSVTFFASAGLVATLAVHRPTAAVGKKSLVSVFSEMKAGMTFIVTHGTLASVIMAMAAGLFAIRCYSALIAIYVRDILHAQAGLFGTMGTMVGVGMIAGTQAVTHLAKTRSRPHLMLTGLVGVGFCILLFALISSTSIALIVTVVMGFFVALVIISAQTLMQGQTPVEMLGRVSSCLMSVLSLAQVGGMAVSGSVAQVIGIRNSYLVSAALLGVISLIGWQKLRTAPLQAQSASAA